MYFLNDLLVVKCLYFYVYIGGVFVNNRSLYLSVIFIPVLLTIGCSSTGQQVERASIYSSGDSVREEIKKPELKETVTISPGESLIYSYIKTTYDAIKLKESIRVVGKYNGFKNQYILNQGVLRSAYRGWNGTYYSRNNAVRQIVSASGTNDLHAGGLFIPDNGSNPSLFFESVRMVKEPINRAVDYEKVKDVSLKEKSFKQEIIFQGITGDEIKLSYREFKNNMSRPAFTQDLTFDILKDKKVGFRGAIFEIIKASNTELKYKVLSHLD